MKQAFIRRGACLIDQAAGQGVGNVNPGRDVHFVHAFSFARTSLSTPHN
jgi:hypothetical protein